MISFKWLFCKHPHVMIKNKRIVCSECYSEWDISEELTEPSGVFARIEERLEQSEELSRLVKLAEEYQQDKEYNER